MNYDILAIGSITTDIFVRPCQLPTIEKDDKEYFAVEVGEKIKLDDVFRSGGGSAGNSAVGFSKLGLNVCPIGVIGDDEEGDHIKAKFDQEHICSKHLVVAKGKASSMSFILNACTGRRTVLHHRTTSKDFNAHMLVEAPQAKGVYVGHLYPDSEGILTALPSWKEKHDAFIAWNPGKTQFKQGIDQYADVLQHTDILILNVEEAEQFVEQKAPHIPSEDQEESIIGEKVGTFTPVETQYLHDVRGLARPFLDYGVKEIIITDGQRGAQGFDQDGNHVFVPTQKDVCVSTLGAGDAFAVGVVGAYYHKKELAEQLLWGSICATGVVKEFGAQHGYTTLSEMKERIKNI